MMRAVLDSNFWLATHVIIITFGYSAMFFAGALAIVFIIKGLLARSFDRDAARSLSAMVYGITCFAALFSLVGTILGGIWGDQSWGRFWGWDPKENGALMIVLMCAIFLRAVGRSLSRTWTYGSRRLRKYYYRVVVVWHKPTRSRPPQLWFHRQRLQVDGLFILSQLFFIVLALLPWRFWLSSFGRERNERKRILIAKASDNFRGAYISSSLGISGRTKR